MAKSRPRSTRPGARLWLGLLLAAAWSTLEAAPDAGRAAPAEPGPDVADREAAAVAAASAREAAMRHALARAGAARRAAATRGPAIVLPLAPDPAPAPATAAPAGPSVPNEPGTPPVVLADLLPEPAAGPPVRDPPPAAGGTPNSPTAPPRPVADTGTGGGTADRAPSIPAASAGAARSARPVTRDLRRDPVETPLQDVPGAPAPAGPWRELLLAVTLNGGVVSQGTLFAEDSRDGTLAVQLAALELWRVGADPGRVLTFQGEPYYPLGAIEGATWEIDREGLALRLDIPPERFARSRIQDQREPVPPPVAGRGGFLDYDLLFSAGEGLEHSLDGLAEAGAFSPLGTVTTGVRLGDLAGGAELVRLDTAVTRDLPGRRASLRLGDGLAGGGAFAAPVRFAGIQYATNFGTDPAFVTFPLPAIGGLAEQESVVDVLVDNLARVGGEVPPGPFAVDNLPVVTGAGEIQLRVTDLLGRERLVTQPYYVSSRLLKPGLHDFAYALGLEREDYGEESFAYGDPLVTTTHRYGLNDRLTAEVHLEAEPDLQGAAAGGSLQLGRLGVVSAGLGASLDEGAGGGMAELGYEYDGRSFNLAARTRYGTEAYAQVGGPEDVRRTDQLNLGVDLGAAGRLGLLLLNRESDEDRDVTTVAATLSRPLGPGAVTFRAAQFARPDAELALTAAYTLPLGSSRNLSTEVDTQGDRRRARAQFRQGRGASDLGLDYRLGAEVTDAGDRGDGGVNAGLDARASYQTAVGTGELEVERVEGEERMRAGLSGSVALLDGRPALSRRIGRSFGVVALPGFPDVRVYLDNRDAGRTDASGHLLLPGLRPYEANKVRVEALDLPLDAALAGGDEATAVPFDRSGVTVAFAVAAGRTATATLVDAAGRPLPAGLRLTSADGTVVAQVARDGFAQIQGAGAAPGGVSVAGDGGGAPVACELPAMPAGKEILPDLGLVTCR